MTGRAIALSALALFAVLLVGWLSLIHRIGPAAPPTVAASAPSIAVAGVTLTSDNIALPDEIATLPAGNDLIAAHCTACHSTELITTQPRLPAEKWQATIDKMRGVYKAPIAPADDTALIAALTALPTQRAAR